MPSGRVKGPENRSKTRLDVLTAAACLDGAKWQGAGIAGSAEVGDGFGKPGGCVTPALQGEAIA
eukprot:2510371-Pleurochrysis_carterae.AAC.1